MILARRQHVEVGPVDEGENAALDALKKILYNDRLTRAPELAKAKHGSNRFMSLFHCSADDDSLTFRQSRRLDDKRRFATRKEVFRLLEVAEGSASRRGNAGASHELFREVLVCFQPCRRAAGAEDDEAGLTKHIGYAAGERIFRPDDNEADVVLPAVVEDGRSVVRIDVAAGRDGGRARIAGQAVQRFEPRRLVKFPRQGVLAAAAAEEGDVQLVRDRVGHAAAAYDASPSDSYIAAFKAC